MEVDDVVLTTLLTNQFGKKNVLRERIIGFGTAKAKGAVTDGAELGRGPGSEPAGILRDADGVDAVAGPGLADDP